MKTPFELLYYLQRILARLVAVSFGLFLSSTPVFLSILVYYGKFVYIPTVVSICIIYACLFVTLVHFRGILKLKPSIVDNSMIPRPIRLDLPIKRSKSSETPSIEHSQNSTRTSLHTEINVYNNDMYRFIPIGDAIDNPTTSFNRLIELIPETSDDYNNFDNLVNTRQISLYRNCFQCYNIQPPRSKHCKLCNICHKRYDHYCILFDQCIDYETLPFFYMFIIYGFISCVIFTYLFMFNDSIYHSFNASKAIFDPLSSPDLLKNGHNIDAIYHTVTNNNLNSNITPSMCYIIDIIVNIMTPLASIFNAASLSQYISPHNTIPLKVSILHYISIILSYYVSITSYCVVFITFLAIPFIVFHIYLLYYNMTTFEYFSMDIYPLLKYYPYSYFSIINSTPSLSSRGVEKTISDNAPQGNDSSSSFNLDRTEAHSTAHTYPNDDKYTSSKVDMTTAQSQSLYNIIYLSLLRLYYHIYEVYIPYKIPYILYIIYYYTGIVTLTNIIKCQQWAKILQGYNQNMDYKQHNNNDNNNNNNNNNNTRTKEKDQSDHHHVLSRKKEILSQQEEKDDSIKYYHNKYIHNNVYYNIFYNNSKYISIYDGNWYPLSHSAIQMMYKHRYRWFHNTMFK